MLHGAQGMDDEDRKAPSTSTARLSEVLQKLLKPHQIDGLHFLWNLLMDQGFLQAAAECRRPSLAERVVAYQRVFGAVLGHSMGLGKTLTSLCFVMLLQEEVHRRMLVAGKRIGDATHAPCASCPRLRVLVVTPRSCIPHWEQSLQEWIRPDVFGATDGEARGSAAIGATSMPVYIPSYRSRVDLGATLERFYRVGGFLVLGYEEHQLLLSRMDAGDVGDPPLLKRQCSSTEHRRVTSLLDHVRPVPEPCGNWRESASYAHIMRSADVAIVDEAHRLKNSKSKTVGELIKNIARIPLRVALTGTPLQNHLDEYVCMMTVITGEHIDQKRFRDNFVLPIERGQCVDATRQQFDRMQTCIHYLRRFFGRVVHRCGVDILERALPPRFETVLFVELSDLQKQAYHAMLMRRGESVNVLQIRHEAAKICTHPVLTNYMPSNRVAGNRQESSGSSSDGADDDLDDDDGYASDDAQPNAPRRGHKHRHHPHVDERAVAAAKLSDSPKLNICIDLIRQVLCRQEKVVVFSIYVGVLKLLARFLAQSRIDSFLLTGDVALDRRKAMMHAFQQGSPGGDSGTTMGPQVFLCSTKAGGVGINLLPANHCILLDTSWNPADDSQATYRIYRYGQRKPVYIYRLSTLGTAEYVVFSYALRKQWMERKVADQGDPHRREREERRHYLEYPCRLHIQGAVDNDDAPLNDKDVAAARLRRGTMLRSGIGGQHRTAEGDRRRLSRGNAHSASDSDASSSLDSDDSDVVEDTTRRRPCQRTNLATAEPTALRFRDLLARCCPLILNLDRQLVGNIRCAVEHSFLLRDNTTEVVQELHKHLEARALEVQRLQRLPTHTVRPEDEDGLDHTSHGSVRIIGRGGIGVASTEAPEYRVDPGLRVAAQALVDVLWDRHCQGVPHPPTREVVATDDAAVWGRAVAARWYASILSKGGAPTCPEPTSLVDVLVWGYRNACAVFVDDVRVHVPKMKAFLDVRCREMLKKPLLEALQTSGNVVWERIPKKEASMCLTECKFRRPFVQQMMHGGLRSMILGAWCRTYPTRTSPTTTEGACVNDGDTREEMEEALITTLALTFNTDVTALSCLPFGSPLHDVERAVDAILDPVVDVVWPEYEGMPPAPILIEALDEMQRPLTRLVAQRSDPVSSASVFTLPQVALALSLPESVERGARRGHYLCKGCPRGIVRLRPLESGITNVNQASTGANNSQSAYCDLCQFNAVDALLAIEPLRSGLILEAWAMGLLHVADVDIGLTMGVEVTKDDATNVLFMQQFLKSPRFAKRVCSRSDPGCSIFSGDAVWRSTAQQQHAFHRLPRLLYELGIDVVLTQLPRHPVMLLALQCGAQSVPDLRARLLTYGTGVWSQMHDGCRATLKKCIDGFRTKSEHLHQRVPELFVLLALQFTTHNMHATADVFDDQFYAVDADGDASPDSPCSPGKGTDLSDGHVQRVIALRDAFFALAWDIYLSKLAREPIPHRLLKGGMLKRSRVDDRLRGNSPPPREYMPWGDDPARQWRRGIDSPSLSGSGSTGSNDSMSLPSPPSCPSRSSSDDERVGFGSNRPRVLQTWTQVPPSTAAPRTEASSCVKRETHAHRSFLFWSALVEVFGPRVLDVPICVETLSRGDEDVTVQDEAYAPSQLQPMLMVPDADHVARLLSVNPMTPPQAADAFFAMMQHRAADIPWIG